MQTQELRQVRTTGPSIGVSDGRPRRRLLTAAAMWTAFVVAALLLMDVVDLKVYGVVVPLAGVALALATSRMGKPVSAFPWTRWHVDRKDLVVLGALYVAVVALFRVAFTVFTTDRVAGLFLSFGAALLIGVAGPVVYTVWVRRRRWPRWASGSTTSGARYASRCCSPESSSPSRCGATPFPDPWTGSHSWS